MNWEIFAIYDRKASVFHSPFISNNAQSGIRAFHRALTQNPVYKDYEEDYELYKLGKYEDKDGFITPATKAEFLISAVEMLGLKIEPADLGQVKPVKLKEEK